MITDTDITKLKKVFATKADLKEALTRALKPYATKNGLKTALEPYATKVALAEVSANLEIVKEDVRELKGEVRSLDAKIDSKFNTVITMLDGFAGRFDRLEMEYHALVIDDKRQDKQIAKLATETGVSFGDME